MDPTLVHLISLKLGYSYFTKLFVFFCFLFRWFERRRRWWLSIQYCHSADGERWMSRWIYTLSGCCTSGDTYCLSKEGKYLLVKEIGVPLGLNQQFSEWRSKKNDDKTVALPGLGDTVAKMFFSKKPHLRKWDYPEKLLPWFCWLIMEGFLPFHYPMSLDCRMPCTSPKIKCMCLLMIRLSYITSQKQESMGCW